MVKKKIVIFGSNDHSKVVFSEIIKLKDYIIEGFIDDLSKSGKKIINYRGKDYFTLGTTENFIKKEKKKRNKKNSTEVSGIIGIGLNYIRKKIVKEVSKLDKNFKWEKIISKNCILNGNLEIGEGSLIMSGVIINTQTKIGKHCIINTSSSIDHDNNFKDYSSCGPGVITGGNVTVGENSHVGIGAIIKNEIKIGKNTIIGGNSYVNKNCSNNSIYLGSPTKFIKKRKENDNYL